MFVHFWILPIISAVVWIGTSTVFSQYFSLRQSSLPHENLLILVFLGMLLAMLIYWLARGSPHYVSMEASQSIAYISDVGATELKPLFIAGSCVTTIFLDASFAADRYLRHKGTLAPNTTMAEKVLSGLAILTAVVGTVGLICLSIFDTVHYPRMHDTFLALFIVGYILSAIFLCAEFQRLGVQYRQYQVLRNSFWAKLTFILVEIALAIVFGVCNRMARNVAAIVEWVIALIFTFWVLSFLIDLLPAMTRRRRGAGKGRYAPDNVEVEGSGPGLEVGEGHGMRVQDGPTREGYEPGYYGRSRNQVPGALAPSRNF